MANLRKSFVSGIMNKDADERLLPEGQYRHAENIVILNSETSENSGVVKNVLSNKKLTNFTFTGTVYNITPKPLVYEAKNKIYWFCKDDVGCYLLEYNINNKITTPILVDTRPLMTRVLKLDKDFLITGLDILKTEDEDKELLLWTDNNTQPCCINIKRAKTWAANSFEEEDILLIKKPPRYALQTLPTYSQDNSNNILDKFISFAYRYKYLDGEYSAISTFTYYKFYPKKSEIDFQTMLNDGMTNQYNAIRLLFNTGDKRVTDVQLLLKQSGSNTIYLIENLNKEENGYSENTEESFIFSNKKILVALPENELYRAFDNIPLKAQAQTLINNFIAYANYLEFYDIPKKPVYDISLISNDITGQELTIERINDAFFKIKIPSTVVLKKDTSLVFNFNLTENVTPIADAGNYNQQLTFYLHKDFSNAAQLAQDQQFKEFIQDVCTENFKSNPSGTPPLNSISNTVTGFRINTYTTDSITIQSPFIVYNIDSFPSNPSDNTTTPLTRNWDINYDDTTVTFNKVSVSSSLKSNRSYEVGIIYLDKYGRASTVQTNTNNTIYVDNEFCTFQNKLKITLYSTPPAWADRYKFVVKQDKEHYNTIFVNIFYREGVFAWVKLEGNNIDKVKKGDTLVVKSDSNGVLEELVTTEVLEIETKSKDFIEDNQTIDNTDIIEESGLYMKIKPTKFNMSFDDSKARTFQHGSHMRYPGRNFTSPKFGELSTDPTPVYQNYIIYPGTTIRIFIEFEARGNIAYKQTYDRRFMSTAQYPSVKDWFEAEVKNLGSFGKDYTWDGLTNIGPNIDSGFAPGYPYPTFLPVIPPPQPFDQWHKGSGWGWNQDGNQFFVVPHRSGTASRKITTTVKFEIIFTEGIVVFETEQKNVDNNIFYETEETFDIYNGNHIGSEYYPILQEQDNVAFLPAIIELDFFNCFVQGQGIESYIYKDKFNANALGIDYRPTSASIESYKQVRRFADVTHSSEPYNESSNVNGLNNFNLSTANFKELDKQYGSVQVVHNRLGDVLVLQEEKAGFIRFGKQAIYASEGEPIVAQISQVLGEYIPYQGNNGIGLNPESFAQDNFRFYWFNSFFGTPIRLSNDGTTEINKGMETYFRNKSIAFRNSKKIGAFDTFNKLYTLKLEEKNNVIDVFDCGNSFQKVITVPYSYILKLNNQIGNIQLSYNISYASVDIKTTFNNVVQVGTFIGNGIITINRNTLASDELLIELTPVETFGRPAEISITNICPVPIPLDIVLVVLNDVSEKGKTIQNRFRSNLNNFLQYEDTFIDNPITKFETLKGFEGQGLFPIQNETITIQSVKRQLHTGEFLQSEECNRLKYLVSNGAYTTANIGNLLDDSTNLLLTKTTQGINQNTFTGSFVFNRTALNQKLYLIWDYTNRKPFAVYNSFAVQKGQVITFNPLSNDINVEPNATVIITRQPLNGTAVVNNNNTITYTHNNSVYTADDLLYVVQGSVCPSNEAIVEFNITLTAPTDAVVSDWTDWTGCISGSQTRTRTVITPATNGGNTPSLIETRNCPVLGTQALQGSEGSFTVFYEDVIDQYGVPRGLYLGMQLFNNQSLNADGSISFSNPFDGIADNVGDLTSQYFTGVFNYNATSFYNTLINDIGVLTEINWN